MQRLIVENSGDAGGTATATTPGLTKTDETDNTDSTYDAAPSDDDNTNAANVVDDADDAEDADDNDDIDDDADHEGGLALRVLRRSPLRLGTAATGPG